MYELHGVNGYIPYSFMDFSRLPGDHDGMALEYLVGKVLKVKIVRVSAWLSMSSTVGNVERWGGFRPRVHFGVEFFKARH